MRNQRLFGPPLAILGAVALFVISLMTWYEVDLSKISIGLGVLLIAGSSRAVVLAGALLALGVIGTLLVLMHILSGPQPSDLVDVQPIAWLGALSALLILAGGYLSFDYAQHSAPQQPKAAPQPKQPQATQPRPQRKSERSSRSDLWDDSDFE